MNPQGEQFVFSIWTIFIFTLLLAFVSVEIGYKLARYRRKHRAGAQEEEKEAPVGAMAGAALGLLAFLLAFTFGMAADNFHERRVAVLAEANAIRITYLRAATIPDPYRTEVRNVLREYVKERLQYAGVDKSPAARSANELLNQLWAQTATVGEKYPSEVIAGFIDSAGDVIKLHQERVMLRERSRIPTGVLVALYVIASLSLGAMGYHGGIAGSVRSPVMVALALAFSLVIMVIASLDRPTGGFIDVSQDAMIDLQNSLTESKP